MLSFPYGVPRMGKKQNQTYDPFLFCYPNDSFISLSYLNTMIQSLLLCHHGKSYLLFPCCHQKKPQFSGPFEEHIFVSPELSSVRDYVITHSVRSM